jgi:RimJ/RimL family protein N-acetyltransferase
MAHWVVVASGGEIVGTVQATVAGDRSVGEVAWIVGEPHQGKGYASEAAEVLVRWLAGESVHRVQADILAGHAASEGVARRAGLHDTGTEANGENLWASGP